ncbi:hypothetical protein PHISCL_08664 [Aspergillus sclerotialis]|uniref:Uncharacterized protein n=1 Tax=Aspergillus sclerotialis TaxID=2070753 RepID=A0A3A2Z7C1_9EURO|nr:hypothetical protein PHISCL_08664 [Aspergillus sclerotialis]
MEAQYGEADQLLPGLEFLQQYDPLYDTNIDPTFLLTDSSDYSLNYIPPLPSLGDSTDHVQSCEKELGEMRVRIDSLEKEIVEMVLVQPRINPVTIDEGIELTHSSTLNYLRTFLTSVHAWMLEVTEALDKLGQAPVSATELEFPENEV